MNKNRRKALRGELDALRAHYDNIDAMRDEEQDYLDNMPENLAYSERATYAEECIDGLDSALSNLSDAIGDLEGVVDS